MSNIPESPQEMPADNPPAEMKVFAPNGETNRAVCWLGIRRSTEGPKTIQLFLLHEDMSIKVLNKKVIVQNLETGNIVYNPRCMPEFFGEQRFLTPREVFWLRDNPHWPNVLELYDNPVDNGEGNDGLYDG